MIELPAEHELVGLFECEPKLADKDIPWCYNRLSFSLIRSDGKICFEIHPAFGEINFWWEQDGQQRVSLKMNHVKSLEVHIDKNDEHILLTGEDLEPKIVTKIRLKPFVSVEHNCFFARG